MRSLILLVISIFAVHNLFAQYPIDSVSFKTSIESFNQGNGMFVIGEAHDVAGTYDLELFIIEQLVSRGYNTILYEGGVSEAALLNQFIKTGDTTILNYTRARGVHYRNFIKGVRVIDSSIIFRGVDFERPVCLDYLFRQWATNMQIPELQELRDILESIQSNSSAGKVKKTLIKARTLYEEQEAAIKSALNVDAEILHDILFNPVFQADFTTSSVTRDSHILETILKIDTNDLKHSILIIGSNHLTDDNLFWSQYRQEKDYNRQSVVCVLAYYNCTNFLRSGKYSSVEPLSRAFPAEPPATPLISFQRSTNTNILTHNDQFIIAKLMNL